MERTSCDVAIVGAGASGAAAAWRLSAAGLSVVCLEQGGWMPPEHSPTLREDWEIVRQKSWHPNPNVRGNERDYAIDDSESDIRPLVFNGVGGSTVMWSCHIPRFHPSDFRMASQDGVGADWPVSYGELEPYYTLNEEMMVVAGMTGNPAYPPMDAPRTPPVGLSPGARRVAEAFNRLGWAWWPADLALNTGAAGKGRGACNHCGPCELHCPLRAKATADLAYWPAALDNGAELRCGARVLEIETLASGAVRGVRYRDAEGDKRLAAPVVILAANGIGSPRLMLASRSRAHPGGLANGSGLVGRGLMLHPLARVTGIFEELTDAHLGINAGGFVSHHFYETDAARGFVRGIKLQGLGSHGPALTALGSLGARVPWGRAHHARFAGLFNHAFSLSVCSDDLPDPENRIVLCGTRTDADGLPIPKMIYRVPQEADRALAFGLERAREALEEAGAVEFIEMNRVPDAGFHLMGTARMGEDPQTSVLDRWCEAHTAPGLFVVDGSAFVTAAAVNPTNTIQALALRASDRILATRQAR